MAAVMDLTQDNAARNRPSRELPTTDRHTDRLHYIVMHAPEHERDRAFRTVINARRFDSLGGDMFRYRRPVEVA